jgi:hypothetical protein
MSETKNDPILENLHLLYNKEALLLLNNCQGSLLSRSIEDKSKQIVTPEKYNPEDYLIDLLKEYIKSRSNPRHYLPFDSND